MSLPGTHGVEHCSARLRHIVVVCVAAAPLLLTMLLLLLPPSAKMEFGGVKMKMQSRTQGMAMLQAFHWHDKSNDASIELGFTTKQLNTVLGTDVLP